MSVSDGQKGNATNFNNAFPSKSTNSTIVAVYDLNAPSSGGNITDIQQVINNNTPLSVVNEEIAGGGTISSHVNRRFQKRRVSGLGGNITTSSTPFGTGGSWDDGVRIRLLGTDDTKKVKILDSSGTQWGVVLNGAKDLGKYDSVDLELDSVLERWIEV